MTNSIARRPTAPSALAVPELLVSTIELPDSFDDDSLEMNEDGDKFRVKGSRKAKRLIGVSEQTISTTSFTPITGCQLDVIERAVRRFYLFRALVVWQSSDVAEGMAARIVFSGTLFGIHRYRLLIGDEVTPLAKCVFRDFSASPTPETGGPGPSAYAYQQFDGAFAVEAGDSGVLSIECAAETGGANSVVVRVPTFLEYAMTT